MKRAKPASSRSIRKRRSRPATGGTGGAFLLLDPRQGLLSPVGHRGEGSGDLFGGAALLPGQLPLDQVLARVKPVVEDSAFLKIAHNAKFDANVLQQHGIDMRPVEDTLLMSYVLDAGRSDHGMDVLSEKYFGHKPIQFGEVAGTGRSFIGFARVAIDRATEYAPKMPM